MTRGRIKFSTALPPPRWVKRLVKLAEDRAFVRGYAAAAALVLRAPLPNEELIRTGGLTEARLKRAGVDDFDAKELLPVIRKMRARASSRRP